MKQKADGEYYVQIINLDTNKKLKTLGPFCANEAARINDGACRNMGIGWCSIIVKKHECAGCAPAVIEECSKA